MGHQGAGIVPDDFDPGPVRRHGIPTTGTAAHAFVLAHGDERAAFASQVEAFGASTTLLVDTFELMAGIRTAVEVAGAKLDAIRLDSGDLLALAYDARALLDELGATATRIVVTGDLDEHAIAALAPAPIDAYGVGTSVVTGSGAPTAGFVYKLVARAVEDGPDATLLPVAKRSPNKISYGGRKRAFRHRDEHGHALAEVLTLDGTTADHGTGERPLQMPLMRAGAVIAPSSVAEARHRFAQSRDELPPAALALSRGEPAIPTRR
ncbi:MAG: hypothetical protein NVSMB13_12390 [Mycobacteriales bacterium]